jgi:hypothetical protein
MVAGVFGTCGHFAEVEDVYVLRLCASYGGGVAEAFARVEINKVHILVEVETGDTGTVVVADVAPLPTVVEWFVIEDVGVIAYATVDAADAFAFNGLHPPVEEGVRLGLAIAVGAEEWVAATFYIYVAVEHPVAVGGTAHGDAGCETEVGPELRKARTGSEYLVDRGGDERVFGVVAVDLFAGGYIVNAYGEGSVLHTLFSLYLGDETVDVVDALGFERMG